MGSEKHGKSRIKIAFLVKIPFEFLESIHYNKLNA